MWYFSIFTLFFVGFVNATEVTSYDKLVEELSNNSEANVVFDNKGNNVDLGGNPGFNVLENQKVELKNIDAWTNNYTETVQNYPLNNTTNKAINISNSGILSIDNVKFKNNEIYVDSRPTLFLGAIIRNPYGHITGITNSIFDNNKVDGEAFLNTFFGGLIINGENEQTNAKIDLIQNVKFTNNLIKSGLNIHGGVIHNTGMIGLIDNVLFENNISQTAPNTWGSLQGGAIDNNVFGVIKKISNSTFRGNKSIRTGYDDAPSEKNYHAGGSAINNMYTIEEIENVIFEDNSIYGEATDSVGGAITNYQNDVNDINQGYIGKITNSKFINNNVYSELGIAYGGAIYNNGARSFVGIENSIFNGNFAEAKDAKGGAIYNTGIIDFGGKNTFSENFVLTDGNNGVINVAQNGIIDINNAKVSNNELNLSNGATFRFDLIQPKTNGLEQIGGQFNGNINLNGQNKL